MTKSAATWTAAAAALCCLLALGAPAADSEKPAPQPRGGKAKAAIAKHAKSIEQAERAYRKAVADAHRALLTELKTAQAVALREQNLDEANAVKAVSDRTANELVALERPGASGRPAATARGGALVAKLTSGHWVDSGGTRGTYMPDGTVRFASWAGPGRWEQTGPNTIRQVEPNGAAATLTFNADVSACLWVFEPGGPGAGTIYHARRHDAD